MPAILFFRADFRDVDAEGGGKVHKMLLFFDEDFPDKLGHRLLTQLLALAHALSIVPDRVTLVFQVCA